MKIFHSFLCLLCILYYSCTNPPYRGKEVVGADEFVMDSYKIRAGKFSILEMEGLPMEELPPALLDDYKDLIHEGDVLQVVLCHPSRGDIVSAVSSVGQTVGFCVMEGKIRLPDLDPIYIEGLTLEEGRQKIQQKYLEQIDDVQVFLAYRERKERKVELLGSVQTPAIAVNGKIRLFEVLSLAKAPPAANFFKSYVVREDKLLPVDLFKLIKEGDMSQNIVMRGGDKIYVAETGASRLMVLGEVGQERTIDLPNGFMSLREALAEAKGISYTGDKAYIQVIRGNILHPKIYTLNWKHIIGLPNDSLLLMPGDIVYVAATPITEWNRFVSQLLPTFIGLDLVTKEIKSIGVNVP